MTARRDKKAGKGAGLTEEQKQEIREAFDLYVDIAPLLLAGCLPAPNDGLSKASSHC